MIESGQSSPHVPQVENSHTFHVGSSYMVGSLTIKDQYKMTYLTHLSLRTRISARGKRMESIRRALHRSPCRRRPSNSPSAPKGRHTSNIPRRVYWFRPNRVRLVSDLTLLQVRFSNDKTPYKTGFSASFSRSGRKGIFAGCMSLCSSAFIRSLSSPPQITCKLKVERVGEYHADGQVGLLAQVRIIICFSL